MRRLPSPGRKPDYATLRRPFAPVIAASLAASGKPGLAAQKCYPCAQTNLLPIFPTAHYSVVSAPIKPRWYWLPKPDVFRFAFVLILRK